MSSKLLLSEYYSMGVCKDGVCQDLLTEDEKRLRKKGIKFLVGVMQRFGEKNSNGRIYSEEILRREVKNYKTLIEEHRAYGELDHPNDAVVNLQKASHRVVDLWWDGNDLMGKVRVLSTPCGNILSSLIDDDGVLGMSSRGVGSTRVSNGVTMVEDDFQLICFDIVADPSTKGAYMHLNESQIKKAFSKEDRINRLVNDILRKK